MTRVRTLLFTALAVVLACGICGQQALAQEDLAGDAYGSVIAIGHVTDASPDVTSPGMYQGITAMGPNPPVSGDWPCFGGATCSHVVAGGLALRPPQPGLAEKRFRCGPAHFNF